MVVASDTDHGYHDTHAKGLAALMKIEHSPLNLLGTLRSGHISEPNKTLQVSKVTGSFFPLECPNLGSSRYQLTALLGLWRVFSRCFA